MPLPLGYAAFWFLGLELHQPLQGFSLALGLTQLPRIVLWWTRREPLGLRPELALPQPAGNGARTPR